MMVANISLTNLLLLEYGYSGTISGLISSMSSLGFVIFLILWHDRVKSFRKHVIIRKMKMVSLICSAFYFFPLTNPAFVFLIGFIRLIDGGMAGLYWPLVQEYTNFTSRVSPQENSKFTMNYNFSWNIGLFGGMFLGFGTTYLWRTDAIGLILNAIAALCMYLISRKISPLPEHIPSNGQIEIKETISKGLKAPILEKTQETRPNTSISRTQENGPKVLEIEGVGAKVLSLPVLLICCLLLTHSLSDGAYNILFPVKTAQIGVLSHWVYFLFFVKYIAQMVGTTLFSRANIHRILHRFLLLPCGIFLGWIFLSFGENLIFISLTLVFLGFLQGSMYASGMRIITQKNMALDEGTIRSGFYYFQITMGSGRMAGPLVLGILSDISLIAIYVFQLSFILFMLLIVGTFFVQKWVRKTL